MFPAQDHRRTGIKRDGSVASTTGEHGCLAQIKSPCFFLPPKPASFSLSH